MFLVVLWYEELIKNTFKSEFLLQNILDSDSGNSVMNFYLKLSKMKSRPLKTLE